MLLHGDGKASLDHIYTQPDPRTYFSTLRKLDYRIPQLAKPHFRRQINLVRQRRHTDITVLDLGCGYGINGALLRCDTSMEELYARYGDAAASTLTRSALLDRDRTMVGRSDLLTGTRFVGLDISAPALSYAREAGFVDDAVRADFERDDPTAEQRGQLAATDLVISTGCLGYVGERTIARIVGACDRPPWMAHFVLRMYPFDPIEAGLAELGYDTVSDERVFRQRMFVSPDEQAQVLATLAELDIDPTGLEDDGWFYARLFVSTPRAELESSP